MKNLQLLILSAIAFTMVSCGGGPKPSTAYSPTAELDKSLTNASIKLKKNPNNKRQVEILESTYRQATAQDLALLESLEKQAATDPSKWTEIYDIYDRMQIREIAVVPLLPLYVGDRQAQFDVPNIDAKTEAAKSRASEQLYNAAVAKLNTGNKLDARDAYGYLDQLIEFNYDFRDARELRSRAKTSGSTNVLVSMINNTGKTLPSNFQDDLLGFRDGQFSDPWTTYHAVRANGVSYDYDVALKVNQLLVGQDQTQQRQYRDQKQVQTGTRDVKDKDGNTVKQAVYQTVYADVLEVMQAKPIRIEATAEYKDNKTGQVVATIPLEREEAWQNVYAQYRGDQRALSQESIAKIQAGKQPFPRAEELMDYGGKLLNQVVVQMLEENSKNLQGSL